MSLQEVMASRCLKRIREKISEQEMWVEGEFASEIDMRDELKFSEWLSSKPLYLLVYLLCNIGFTLQLAEKKIQHLKVCNTVNNSGWGIAEEPDQGHQSGMWETPWMD